MSVRQPEVVIVAGPNGAGKSTTASALLSTSAPFTNYLNPDLIARGIAPLDPMSVSFAAGRIMHRRIQELIQLRESFAFETTLSGRTYVNVVHQLLDAGFNVNLIFLWLKNADLAVERVASRVRNGGHTIPEEDIRRRYDTGIKNFFDLYRDLLGSWKFYDNSDRHPELVARKSNENEIVQLPQLWDHLCGTYIKRNDYE